MANKIDAKVLALVVILILGLFVVLTMNGQFAQPSTNGAQAKATITINPPGTAAQHPAGTAAATITILPSGG